MSEPRIIAFYLPQFHPIPENDEWWGKGFTEWTNVARAKPLFRGHYQPKLPADLGFYDLRVPETRKYQAELAKEAGIEGFCYYHYWFGSENTPRELMQMPFNEVVRTHEPDFPFCLCWANHSFEKKMWDSKTAFSDKTILVEQKYYGTADYEAHFYSLLDAFKDSRYIKVNGKNLFVIYDPKSIPDISGFMDCWNNLARQNGVPEFCFVAYLYYNDYSLLDNSIYSLFEAKIYHSASILYNNIDLSFFRKNMLRVKRVMSSVFRTPMYKMDYDAERKRLVPPVNDRRDVIPEILSGFDHSPRTGRMRLILHNFTPDSFYRHIMDIFSWLKNNKGGFNNLVFLKSWNEWGEGNYMEPDMKYGKGYIKSLREAIRKFKDLK